jgi:hypothetical protein
VSKASVVSKEGLATGRQYLAVTISRKLETFALDIPFYCYTEESKFDRYRQQREETYYVCEKRNRAMTKALEMYSQSTHVLSLDTYYLNQTQALKEMIRAYDELDNDDIILGAPIWYYRKNRLIDNRPKFYDAWGSPELENIHPRDTNNFPPIIQVPSVGNCVIFPVWVWKKYKFLTPEPFPSMGSCYTRLSKLSGLPVLMDMQAKLIRDRTNNPEAYYPFSKRLRVSVGDYRNRLFRKLRPSLS